ncbi:MAG: tetratricopeptide repeat protein [Bacteroidia bacterium]|nr:tetratricopeptide repeat protein [Bacteroidia bacterium]
MASKIKARDLEEEVKNTEEVSEGKFSIEAFVVKNRNLVLVGVAIVALVIAGVIGYNVMRSGKNTEASSEMFQAVKYFEADSLDLALNGDGQALGFLDIVDEYSGTDAANVANFYLGAIYNQKGDLESSREYLEKVSLGDNLFSMSVLSALAFVYEDLGNPDKAASLFEKAAYTPGENEATTPTMLLNAGRNYEAAGKPEKALDLYEKIKEDFPTSTEGLNIDKYIGRVSE